MSLTCQVIAQNNTINVAMRDNSQYTDFGISEIANNNYPPSNLFDGKLNTCWVTNLSGESTRSLYIRIPETLNDSIYINIFNGYGKSRSLFEKNSRPREITLHFYSAFTPDGYVSENNYLCKAFQLTDSQTIEITDTFGIQRFLLQYTRNDIREFGSKHQHLLNHPNCIDTLELIMLQVSGIYHGDKYPQDVCMSELYFDNCYSVQADKEKSGTIADIYLNEEENEFWINKNGDPVKIYSDSTSILQIIQKSSDNEWAVLIAMPNNIEGRAEASYLLFDLIQEELVNLKLKQIIDSYIPGQPLYLETIENKQFIIGNSFPEKELKVELRHYFY